MYKYRSSVNREIKTSTPLWTKRSSRKKQQTYTFDTWTGKAPSPYRWLLVHAFTYSCGLVCGKMYPLIVVLVKISDNSRTCRSQSAPNYQEVRNKFDHPSEHVLRHSVVALSTLGINCCVVYLRKIKKQQHQLCNITKRPCSSHSPTSVSSPHSTWRLGTQVAWSATKDFLQYIARPV